jgi:hypothetical protein
MQQVVNPLKAPHHVTGHTLAFALQLVQLRHFSPRGIAPKNLLSLGHKGRIMWV